ncbi:hypothetical protein LSTR_LSTR001194 [Laodelphax striatellus]|uniref:Transmembrane protein 87A n=1 Tax=Laodelphax striatellus TaxID=195883 RepID=A0A482X1P9_LAOST|nr:hypothetical protein LSTR_LSTR001194 [Laodelphax striatellus]
MCQISIYLSICLAVLCFTISPTTSAFPDPGKWELQLTDSSRGVTIGKSLFKKSTIRITAHCDRAQNNKVSIIWYVGQSGCWKNGVLQNYPELERNPEYYGLLQNASNVREMPEMVTECECSNHSIPCELKQYIPPQAQYTEQPKDLPQNAESVDKMPHLDDSPSNTELKPSKRPTYVTPADGFYMLTVEMAHEDNSNFEVTLNIEMFGEHGYLSAGDWPLLPFYGSMCLVYVAYGLGWLTVSFLQWRDLLRIQFWIGGVILLGMLEKAVFYAEYQNVNSTGQPVPAAVLVAELVSCGKRTLARMLVIIVSLGFGIVKPRLGAMLHRVVGTGVLYFVLAASEAYVQVMRSKSDPANQLLMANVPLAVLDSAICWWIFTSLVQTTRTLRLRRNLIKLTLYQHFTATLTVAVFSSIIFMLYSIRTHHFTECFQDWQALWVDEAFWRLLFSVILLVIMILWRPTNNNQRYAFTPLLDAPEDDDDDEEEQFINNAYGVKMRAPTSGNSSPKQKTSTNSLEEDLKWVEDNIPTSLADR